MRFQPLFSSFVCIDQLEDYVDNDAIVDVVYDRYKDDTKLKFAGGWSSGHLPLSLLDEEPLKSLKDQIDLHVNEIKINHLGIKQDVEHTITNYWANIFEPFGKYRTPANPPHIHAGYFLSVVYYPKAQDACGDLILIAPFSGIETTMPFKQLERSTFFNASRWMVKPEPAKLVIFPSWLMHFVEVNQSEEDRLSIAFNISLPHVDL